MNRTVSFPPHLNKDITTMVKLLFKDTYHSLLTCSWFLFFSVIFGLYFTLNILFGVIFSWSQNSFLIPAHLQDVPTILAGFFMSIQTMSTIGYGGMLPQTIQGEVIVTFESMIGLVFTAVSTGLTFARLAQPSAQILFADLFLLTKTERGPALIFRIANARGNDIINAQASLSVINLDAKSRLLHMVDLKDLTLRRNFSPTFYLNWIIVHDIDEDSPIYHMNKEELTGPNMIYILNISGHDSSFNQTIFKYKRYGGQEGRFGSYFKDMIIQDEHGQTKVILENLSLIEERATDP
jgi:inward rectifier potassium channel